MEDRKTALNAAPNTTGMSLKLVGEPFAIVPLSTILDPRMTPAALGILNYLIARANMPGGWTFYTTEIARHFNTGKSGGEVRTRLNELEDLGYIRRSRVRGPDGRLVGMDMAVSATAVLKESDDENSVSDSIASTSRFPSCGQTSCGKPSTNKIDNNQKEKTPMSASADGVESGEKAAETDEQSHSVKASPATTKTKKDRKSQGSGTPSVARTVAELRPFLDAWNEHRNPARMSLHRALDDKQIASLRKMIEKHGGDVEAALASWTLAVRKVAAVDCHLTWNFWGEPNTPRRNLSNLSANWGKHAVDFEPIAAPATVASNWTPSEDLL